MNEEWKDIPFLAPYEGKYQASNKGRIRLKECETVIRPTRSRYGKCLLIKFPNRMRRPVHQLVMHAFNGTKAPEGTIAGPKDGNFFNLELSNLAWIDYSK